MSKKLLIKIGKDGSKTVEADGIVGSSCVSDNTDFLQQIGMSADKAELTDDFHAIEEETESIHE